MAYNFERSLVHQFHRASQFADELFAKENDGTLPTPRQSVVLAAIAAQSGASQTDIVKSTGIDRSTLADIVRRLVARQMVARKRSRDDARANVLQITNGGRAALEVAERSAQRTDEQLLQALGPADRECLMSVLTTIFSQQEQQAE